MKLSILDQSQIAEGRTAKDALAETTRLAQEADRLGYDRYWVSEHHASGALAHSSPEVLIAHLAAHTNRIRLGSGGVMMPHYSAYKVAENFRLLEALHPGRIDIGLGRAPGGMPLSTRALQEGKYTSVDRYPQQVADLITYLYDQAGPTHAYPGLFASPVIDTAPELWLLGSSGESARLSAQLGLAYAYAQFFGVPGGEDAIRSYKAQFRPSALNEKAHAMAAVYVVCADTEEEAERLASSTSLFFLMLHRGGNLRFFPSIETTEAYPYDEIDIELINQRRSQIIVGTPETVRTKLLALAERYDADELMIVTNTHNFEARLHSYRLVAEAFQLQS
ncbi:LLM class flavin-dependent oxidoreductase [Paenibacillus sp. MMS18-CY102]|uniref:LLM class flavin-dependent oxidoreductase n=1 Tax=Paenibacillus sp. MMS18-CY102 TaxID=2682849 RepID=UPI0013654E42|nr:LLM class flavin-dependent oxidoreductase [Paenibacillus sp. MMS18-CY102]MWC28231.1 MsnO8 family LLM class oxidoreductase [Paenibacillus sp. MMS18-CY102]